jgi:hypothetical protein
MPQTATATIQTDSAKRYLGQFAKHFAHKLPVNLDDTHETATVPFPFGPCALQAEAAALHIAVSGATPEDLAKLKDFVARHLVRFAFREELAINWQPPS